MTIRIFIPLIVLVAFTTSCRKPFEPPEIKVETNYLVVDGTIAIGNGEVTTITLSRTRRISDSVTFYPEENASVYIEPQQGPAVQLGYLGNGIYQSAPLSLQAGILYRLRIMAGTKEYISAYVAGRISPGIDSVTWKQDGDVTISVHTHDPMNNTRNYRWDYIETWNYSSFLSSAWGVQNGLVYPKDSITQTDSCWRTARSTNIAVGSSIALTNDVISNFPIATVKQHSEKISKGYSILVKQYAITDSAYRYLRLIEKNSQQMGTLFDGQPSQLRGNILCVENANEPVIGFINASTVSEKRIFIRNRQLSDWHYAQPGEDCGDIILTAQDPTNYAIYTYPDPRFSIYYFVSGGMILARKSCLECTEHGGTNVKPSFW